MQSKGRGRKVYSALWMVHHSLPCLVLNSHQFDAMQRHLEETLINNIAANRKRRNVKEKSKQEGKSEQY
jgi:hypothetical protein